VSGGVWLWGVRRGRWSRRAL
jgi:hypothetical protein